MASLRLFPGPGRIQPKPPPVAGGVWEGVGMKGVLKCSLRIREEGYWTLSTTLQAQPDTPESVGSAFYLQLGLTFNLHRYLATPYDEIARGNIIKVKEFRRDTNDSTEGFLEECRLAGLKEETALVLGMKTSTMGCPFGPVVSYGY